jgi:hypothetical protein
MKFDLQEIAALLHIHEKALGHPRLKPLSDAVMKHLEGLADEEAQRTAPPKPEVEAEAVEDESTTVPSSREEPPTEEQFEDINKRSA